jgi:hypothetical protein
MINYTLRGFASVLASLPLAVQVGFQNNSLVVGVVTGAGFGVMTASGLHVINGLYTKWRLSKIEDREKFENNLAYKIRQKHPNISHERSIQMAEKFYRDMHRVFSKHPPKNPYKLVKNPKGSAFSYRKVKI